MQEVDELHVKGALSCRLMANLEEFMEIWHCWLPEK
jgi:hypothetical protein